jgi:predicted nuclease of restriction endonuclease-like (RecB) superfamily
MAMSSKKKQKHTIANTPQVDENLLFLRVAEIIENRKKRTIAHVSQETTLMFWEVGQYVNSVLLGDERAVYGRQIVSTLSTQLAEKYGKTFELRNLRRMIQFAKTFSNQEIVSTLSTQLSWSHIIEILPLKTQEAKLYYANEVAIRQLGIRELRQQIARKAYERREIATIELSKDSTVPFNVFKDPYLLDLFGLKENFAEADLEKAILVELEAFLLEFGHGFTFVERQKRMIIDDEDIVLDLLFYHRILKRLVAVELKLGVFKAAYKGQMELYLKWLDRYERKEGEEAPIGIILCATASREKVELLEMDKAGIAVAEYWTHLPPKAEFETKIKTILLEARERLERRRAFPQKVAPKRIEYFYESKDDDTENQ